MRLAFVGDAAIAGLAALSALSALSALAIGPIAAEGQSPPIRLHVSPSGTLALALERVIEDDELIDALHSGLPLRVSVLVELWRDGLFDSEVGRHEWRASLHFDPLDERYRLATSTPAGPAAAESGGSSNPPAGVHQSLDEARNDLGQEVTVPLIPPRPGTYYYLVRAEVRTLSLSDLQELERWLQGDLEVRSDASGDEERGGAVGRGVRRAFVRALGLPARRVRLRTDKFEVPDPDPSS